MADFDRDKLSEEISNLGMDEVYFVNKVKAMIDKGGHNMAAGMKMLGELKGLGKRTEQKNTNTLSEFGMDKLLNSVQQNRRLNGGVEEATVIDWNDNGDK